MPDVEALARAHARAVEADDTDALAALHEPDVEIWHNTDGVTQNLEENLKLNAWLHRKVPDLRFEEVQINYTDNGFVRRNTLVGTAPDGSPFRLYSILLVELSSAGKIAKIWEYIDSAAVAALSAR